MVVMDVHLLGPDGQFLTSEGGGSGSIMQSRTITGPWEMFALIRPPAPFRPSRPLNSSEIRNKVLCCIRSVNGKYFVPTTDSEDVRPTETNPARAIWQIWDRGPGPYGGMIPDGGALMFVWQDNAPPG